MIIAHVEHPDNIYNALVKEWPGRGNLGDITTVPCDAVGPALELTIGGKKLVVEPHDMFIIRGRSSRGDVCSPSVQPAGRSINILGGPFLRSVLAVFDVGASEMRFAQRVHLHEAHRWLV